MNIPNDRPVALYNADKQELIGLFQTPNAAGRYIFDGHTTARRYSPGHRVTDGLKSKSKIHNSRFEFAIACRYVTDQQREELGKEQYLIKNGYPAPTHAARMQGFTGNFPPLGGNQKKKAP